ncbi:MAG: hypothetical protein WCF24_07850 [Acidimicrobiales bacterium]
MPTRHIVVDGSNLATEGRTTPSLVQLEEVVADLRREMQGAQVTVVVDATFRHRIDPSERERYDELVLSGDLVSPPAGAVGRGDAFLLRIAEKVDGIVLSNDSFQEFHGEHPWLFDRGRLMGASRVPGVGWIFVYRSPVRGPKDRKAQSDSKRAKKEVERAIASATKEAVTPSGPQKPKAKTKPPSKSASPAASPRAVNDPVTFIAFVSEHRPGEEVDAVVDGFTSHGAVVRSGDVMAYVPLSGLGDPAPRSARAVLKKGESRRFVVTALDPYRRGVEVALPEAATVSGRPSEETVAAVVKLAHRRDSKTSANLQAKRGALPAKVAKSPTKKSAPRRVENTASTGGRRRSPQSERPLKAVSSGGGPRRSPRAERALKAVPKPARARPTNSADRAARKRQVTKGASKRSRRAKE